MGIEEGSICSSRFHVCIYNSFTFQSLSGQSRWFESLPAWSVEKEFFRNTLLWATLPGRRGFSQNIT